MFWRYTILKFYIRVIEAGIGFALVLAVVFASFRTQKPEKKRYIVFLGILTGFIGSIVSAILRSIPNYINRTNFAFWSMIPVSIFFLILIVLLLFKTKAKKSLLYENIFGTSVFLYTAATIFYYLPVIITLSTTLVNYGESAVSTLVLYRLIGYLLGIVFIILASLSIYKTLIKLSDIELNITVIASLCILGITQVVVIIQRLYSLRIIPRNDFIFLFIATVVNNGNFFIFAVIVFIMFAPILLWKKNIKITEAYNNNAELRKIKAKKRNAKRWARFSLSLLLISVFSLSFLRFYVDREVPLSPPENYTIADGMAVISLEQLEDDKLHRYEYITEQGISMRFIAIKKSEGAYGVGLDACDICGPSGYFERNNEVICKLCDVVMNKATIGFPGGCNPVPIPYIVHDGNIKIKISDLESEAHRFK
ncbi:DUF2318 domain-containing protein [Treponema denticola]|uniref:Fe-S-containing protein n=1 Tax=Treponema denticola TaxID=158 RepID=UPI0020A434C9|nr:Fe-S-containing protein [Treponema denticola]UTD13888.1 DUF2318 domain-containing protein [Treponema denticola]